MTTMDSQYRFRGFELPRYTIVPDALFDELLPVLSGAELKILLYILRRTFGFRKSSDDISIAQIMGGIEKRDGDSLDHGTGLSRDSVVRAVKSLVDKEIIVAIRNRTAERGDEPTTYALHMANPEYENRTRGGTKIGHGGRGKIGLPRVRKSDSQETVKQETVDNRKSNIRRDNEGKNTEPDSIQSEIVLSTPSPFVSAVASPTSSAASQPAPTPVLASDREVLATYLGDFAGELGDHASLTSTTTRALRLYQRSDLSRDAFIHRLYEARAITQERSTSIRGSEAGPRKRGRPAKNKMPFFFAVLEDLLGMREDNGIDEMAETLHNIQNNGRDAHQNSPATAQNRSNFALDTSDRAAGASDQEPGVVEHSEHSPFSDQYPPRPIPDTPLTTSQAWQRVLAEFYDQVTPSIYETWLQDTALQTCDGHTAIVVARDRFQADWLTHRFDGRIQQSLTTVLGYDVVCRYVVWGMEHDGGASAHGRSEGGAE